ncbi:uncharacterized protein LOC131876484 [Cryptomeria japonica]|uniref:uncharacterized protein LOC131876484 n=1 Tax=Cryptomeria japonica TaxID=3369 RepID=UPI0027DAB494|nr:uncharacterized protein LOC131876484 [Cryptomeria japonica]
MEAVEPWTVWIMSIGYEVDAGTLDAYAQNLLNGSVDSKEERVKNCKEKSMELNNKFIEPKRKRKVANIVEDILVEEGHPREKVRATRTARDAEEKEKKQKIALAPIKAKVIGSSPIPVKTPPIESKPSHSSAKDLDLHKKFTGPAMKRKVRKEVEELLEKMGISNEVVQREREQNILKEEDMENSKKTKPFSTSSKKSKPREFWSAPTFDVQKTSPPPKPQSTPTSGVEKRKKEKPQRVYVAATTEDIETKFDEVVKEVKKTTTYAIVVKKPHPDQRIDVNLEEPSHETPILEVHKVVLDKKKDQSPKKAILKGQSNDQTPVDDDSANVDIFGDIVQELPVIEVISEKEAKEIVEVEKGKDGDKDESAEVGDKGEKEKDHALVTVARDVVLTKEKQVAIDSNDFGQGPIDLRSLSPIQELKLATLTQDKANEDFVKSHSSDKDLISLAGDMLQKIMPSFKLDTFDPSSKIKGLLNVVGSHFESLEKIDTKSPPELDTEEIVVLDEFYNAKDKGDTISPPIIFFMDETKDVEDTIDTTGTYNELVKEKEQESNMVKDKKAEEAPTTEQSVDMPPPPVKEHNVESQLPPVIKPTQEEHTEIGKDKPEKKTEENKDKEKKMEKQKKTTVEGDDDDSISIKGPIDMDNLSDYELMEISTAMQSKAQKKRFKENKREVETIQTVVQIL